MERLFSSSVRCSKTKISPTGTNWRNHGITNPSSLAVVAEISYLKCGNLFLAFLIIKES